MCKSISISAPANEYCEGQIISNVADLHRENEFNGRQALSNKKTRPWTFPAQVPIPTLPGMTLA